MIKKSVISALFFLVAASANAQSVGLVLSGGGAKGLYHIGVIRALEENGIPIDYISGTSMGSIVAGMYAAGYTPAQMEAEFTGERIEQWLTGRIERRYRYYFKEMERDAAMLRLRFDGQRQARRRRGGLPDNLISSDQLDLGFVEYFATASAAAEGDFDRLFVPLRCVATDATHQREVVFRSGDLGKAIRASMSIPMLFKPMQIDSALLYDGGLFNNFPWQPLVEDFAPDILIGSKCVEDKSSLTSTSMMEQAFVLTMLHTDYTLPRAGDVMIERTFADVSTMDFGKAARIIEAGYEDAMRMMPRLREQIARRADPAEVQARRAAYRATLPELRFGSYQIEGLAPRQADYIHHLLTSTRRSKDRYTLEGFRTEYFKILAEGEIEGEYPDVRYDSLGERFDLRIRMHAKPSLQLKIGGNVSSTALNQAYIGLEYHTLARAAHTHRLDAYFSPFYTSLRISSRTDLYWRLPLFLELGGSYNYYNYFRSDYGMVSRASDLRYGKYEDLYAHAIIGTPLGRHSVLTLQTNGAHGHYRYSQLEKLYERGDELDVTNFDFVGVKIEVERYNLNYPLYPTGGVQQTLSGIFIGGREHYRGGIARAADNRQSADRSWIGGKFVREQYFPIAAAKWFSLGYLIDLTLTSHPAFWNDYASNITMPAFTPTPHSRIVYMSEFRASSYAAGGLTPIFRIIPNLYLRASAYAFLPGGESMDQMSIDQRMRYLFDVSAVYQTFIGPVSLSLSKYDARGENNFFLTFNFGWAIFNKRSLFY